MLQVSGLHAWYGRSHILQGLDLEVRRGEIVCLVGRNGAGKTTTLRSVMGLVGRAEGRVLFEGADVLPLPAHARNRLGIGYVPEERRIVQGLSVRDNLRLGLLASRKGRREREVIEEVGRVFPRLAERLDQVAVTMSGGEQQMLAIGRALMGRPKILLLDEPSLGLAPQIIDGLFDAIEAINKGGMSILLIEQNAALALEISHRAYVIETGRIILEGRARDVLDDARVQEAYLGA
jgi:branched-chain amino acid transport system ATP-binding protein